MNFAPMQSSAVVSRPIPANDTAPPWLARSDPRSASCFHTDAPGVVFVVDDDESIRESLEALLLSEGWRCETFESAEAFLSREGDRTPSCLVLDVHLPELGGLDLQKRLVMNGRGAMPVIFISGGRDVPTAVRAMKAGAVEFLTKPFDDAALLDAVRPAVARSALALDDEAGLRALRQRYASLSRREREVMDRIVAGRLNKQVGGDLGISEITVKAHRRQTMSKMAASSFADLVGMAARLRSSPLTA
jgi:FixJ family two-component response regulator